MNKKRTITIGLIVLLVIILTGFVVNAFNNAEEKRKILSFREAVYRSYICSTSTLDLMMKAGTDYHNGKRYFYPVNNSMVNYEDVDARTAVVRDYSTLPIAELAHISTDDENDNLQNCVRCYSQDEAAYCVKQFTDKLGITGLNDCILSDAQAQLPKGDNHKKLNELLLCADLLKSTVKYEDADYKKLLVFSEATIINFKRLWAQCDSLYPYASVDKNAMKQQVLKEIEVLIKSQQK